MKTLVQVRLLVPFLLVFFLDQGTKFYFPVLTTTSRMSLVVSLIAFMVIGVLALRQRSSFARMALVIIVAAGVSNLVDLGLYGYVRDIFRAYSLVFNVADIAILAGILVFAITNAKQSINS